MHTSSSSSLVIPTFYLCLLALWCRVGDEVQSRLSELLRKADAWVVPSIQALAYVLYTMENFPKVREFCGGQTKKLTYQLQLAKQGSQTMMSGGAAATPTVKRQVSNVRTSMKKLNESLATWTVYLTELRERNFLPQHGGQKQFRDNDILYKIASNAITSSRPQNTQASGQTSEDSDINVLTHKNMQKKKSAWRLQSRKAFER